MVDPIIDDEGSEVVASGLSKKKKAQISCIGKGRTLYTEPTSNKKSKGISRFKSYQEKGGKVNGKNTSNVEVIAGSSALTAFNDLTDGGVELTLRGRGEDTTDKAMQKMENMVLELFPESAMARMLKAWEDYDSEQPQDILFSPLKGPEVSLLIHLCTKMPNGESTFTWTCEDEVKTVETRHNGYKTVSSFLQAIKYVCKEANVSSPTENGNIVAFMKDMRLNYVPLGAGSVEPVEFLTAIYEDIHNNSNNTGFSDLKQAYLWALLLIMWNLFARPCEMAKFCPCVECTVLSEQIDAAGDCIWV
jgi:hypothetical protein